MATTAQADAQRKTTRLAFRITNGQLPTEDELRAWAAEFVAAHTPDGCPGRIVREV